MNDIREQVVLAAFEALCDTDDMSEMGRAETVADRILKIPAIAAALRLKTVKPLEEG